MGQEVFLFVCCDNVASLLFETWSLLRVDLGMLELRIFQLFQLLGAGTIDLHPAVCTFQMPHT